MTIMEILIPLCIIGFIVWNLFGMMFALECLMTFDDDVVYTPKRVLKMVCLMPVCGPLASMIMCIDIIRNIVKRGNMGDGIRKWMDS